MRITLEQLSEIGKVRSHNEDSIGTQLGTPNGDVYVVCDGMGGHVGGAIASSLAVKSILEHFAREKYSNIIQAIDQAFQFANEQIYVHTQVQPELKGMGTTGVILVLKDDKCFFGHVGDSRLYLRSNNELHRLTKDHSYVQELVDKKVITDDEAERHPQKNQILRALGHHSEVKPDVCEVPAVVKNGDVFLLCSDGLNGMLNDEVMNSLIHENDLADSKIKLFEAAMANGGNDNISLMLLGIKDSPHTKSEFKSYSPGKVRRVQEHKYERTQQFATDSSSSWANPTQPKKQSQKWILVAVAALVIIAGGITAYIKLSTDDPPKPVDIKGYTLAELKSMNRSHLEELAEKKVQVVSVMNEQEIEIDKNKYLLLIIENDKLVGVKEKITSSGDGGSGGGSGGSGGETQTIKDRDKDGIADAQDKCPDDPKNKCETTNQPAGPKVPKDVQVLKGGIYSIQANDDGKETVIALHKRLKGRADIMALGESKNLCTPGEIIKKNPELKLESDDVAIEKGKWVRFYFK